MRIGIAGKGGAGKTTVAATMARQFAQRGFTVNALDGDPNPNLAAALGLDPGQTSRLQRVPSEVLEERLTDRGGASMHLRRPFPEVVAEYGVVGPDGVRMLNMTGLLGAGKGCICGQHSMVRGVVAELNGESRDVTILDMEASLEHMSRGTVRHVDALVIVIEPYYRALETLKRTAPLARDLAIPTIYALANKVRSADDEMTIRDYCERLEVDLLATVPWDDAVAEADRLNRALVDHMPTAPAAVAIGAAVDTLASLAADAGQAPASRAPQGTTAGQA